MMRRIARFAVALLLGSILCSTAAPASVDVATGIRYVIPTGPMTECSTKAQTALNAYLPGATESSPGSNEFVSYGPNGRGGQTSVAATVHCNPVGTGYVVTFDCVAQVPNNPYSATDLCLDIAHNFSGKPVTPLATAPPAPTGCSPANAVGTWTSDNRGGPTLTITADGNLTDTDGVSGNWVLYNTSLTITYYGNHVLTISPDGKHLSGGDYHLTRKC